MTLTVLLTGALLLALQGDFPFQATSASAGGGDPSVAPAEPQRRAKRLRPKPRKATDSRGEAFADGCQLGARQTVSPRPPRCVYGKRNSKTTVALVGDSQALMYFPGLKRLANRRGWRLLSLTKVGCPPIRELVYNRRVNGGYTECLKWLKYVIKRLRRGRPEMIATTGWMWHKAMRGGRPLKRATWRNRRILEDGYVRFLRRMPRGSKLVVMKSTPKAYGSVPNCVKRNRRRMDRCAFEIGDRHDPQSFDRRAAHRVKRATLVNVIPVFCPDRLCHAVINGRIVYRDAVHFTAPYSRVLFRQIRDRLPLPLRG